MKVYFSPGEACRDAILEALAACKKTLDICVFTISDNDIARAIKDCQKRGVKVRIITDNDKTQDEGSDVAELKLAGVAVRMDAASGHMHHKFAIIDGKSLLNGSYNWTRSAFMYNQENVMVTSDKVALAAFQKEFDKLWKTFG